MQPQSVVSDDPNGGALVRVKAVPGASRDAIAGVLGDRLKVRVSAPAEGGKANRAICAVLARALGARERDVEVASGAASAEKVLRITGVDAASARQHLGLPSM
jgi:uncharacterized protein (TIGR00251 family)